MEIQRSYIDHHTPTCGAILQRLQITRHRMDVLEDYKQDFWAEPPQTGIY